MDRTISIDIFPKINIYHDQPELQTDVLLTEESDGIYHYRFTASSANPVSPKPVTLRWRLPAFNVKGVWKCGDIHNKRLQYDWELDHLESRISVDAPVVSVYGHEDQNVLTFACSDAINLLNMNALLREEDNHLYFHITFFAERHPEITSYEADLRIDVRDLHFSKPLQAVSKWWESFDTLKPCPVPALAKAPLYSTWYNFHQDLEESVLVAECEKAVDLGYELIIIDDGWQTMDNNRGYDYTGDWEPDRFPDMAGFVEKIHDVGMKVGLWFSVPFCGKKSKAYQEFKGKFLTENHRWAPVFDPRFPEVRAYLIDIYVKALKNYNLDAFKLDFIDDFKVYPETELTKSDGRDYANVNEAVDRLMSDVMNTLRNIKPDIAIEFRQQYVGPAMRKFGNMFRAFDCPNDPITNRIRITDVKLLCGSTAVHSDMLTWHPEEPVELAALQVLNSFFAVPQMSILLDKFPIEHVNMVRFYNHYWKENAAVLLSGNFNPQKPLANYPVLASEQNGHHIIGVYEDFIIEIPDSQRIDLLNSKMSAYIVVNSPYPLTYEMTSWNCQGEKTTTELLKLPKGVSSISVPAAGMVRLEKMEYTTSSNGNH